MAFSFAQFYRSRTVRNIATFAGGNVLASVFGIIGGLVQAHFVGPEEMGVFRMFTVVTGYLSFLHLGVFDGLLRDISVQAGRGNRTHAERVAGACLSYIVFISALCTTLFISFAIWAACHHKWMYFWGWLASVPVIIMSCYGTQYLVATYRTGDQFVRLARASVIQSVVGLLIVPLLPIMGYYGACLRAGVSAGVNVCYLHIWRPLRMRPRLDWHDFYHVIRLGFRLSVIGFLWNSLWTSVEGTLILGWYGTKALGLYGVACVIRTVGAQFALSMNQVMGIKIYEQHGRTGKAMDSVRLTAKPMICALVGSVVLMGGGWLLAPWAIRLIMPAYIDATRMTQLMLPMVAITVLQLPITILWATARVMDCFISIAGGFAVFVVCAFCLKTSNMGADGVIVGSIVGHAAAVLLTYFFIFRLVCNEKQTASAVILRVEPNVAK
jgi:O-antigen/teichoic acid export membrane protein